MGARDQRNLFELFQAVSYQHPDRIASQHATEELSYADLIAHARAFGEYLRARGLGPGNFAALLLENSIEYAIAFLGILATGAIAVPLNPETSRSTLKTILLDCGANVLIARSRVLDRLNLPVDSLKTIALVPSFAENRTFFGKKPDPNPANASAEDPAIVLYTSGTTGRPKGVVLTHRNLLANTRSTVEYLSLTSEDSIVNVLPFFHSFGTSVLLTHLAVGAKIVIESRFAFPSQVIQTMQSVRPTGFAGVPTTFEILIHETTFLKQDWRFLRYISQAGGGMRVETVQQLRQAMPNTSIFIMYGQTEAAPRLSYLPPKMLEQKLGSIGKAIPGVELDLVDANGQSVRGDDTGEIVARGDNLMRGYLNDPEGTAEVLRDGWLYTGDMARRDADGYLYIVSRKGDFIKSAGHRISPGEVEEVIAAGCPDIEDVAVIGVPDDVLGEALAACVCCPESKFEAAAILSVCAAHLPLHKVPKYAVRETEIPRTASGKKKYFLLREKYRLAPLKFP
jgi:long-chain acyl-CoA synthetase